MIESKTALEIKNKYETGERDFTKLELRRVDLRGLNLSQANFKGADLSYANLREVNLSGSDLSEAFLNEADLTGANLQGANLQGSYLIKTYLIKTNLQEANLSKAYLTGAYLSKSILTNANLVGAYLNGTKLNGVDLTGVIYDATTHFDVNFKPIKTETKKDITRTTSLLTLKVTPQELLNTFNHLSKISARYLGNTMTVRYWETTRPQSEWLNQFDVKASAQIDFTGTQTGYLDVSQLRLAQEWVNRFVKICSQIIQEYSQMIDHKQVIFNLPSSSIADTSEQKHNKSEESIMRIFPPQEESIGLF